MGTAGARLQFTRRPMVKLIPSFRKFRDIIVQQMKKLAEIGADGLHFDKLAWGPALMFNKEADISPDRANWEGILAACGEVLTECRAVNPEFCISFEGAWDRMAEFSDVVWMWHSTWEKDHVPVLKYTFSQWIPCLSISQPYDYNIVNNAMRYGYQMFIGPAHYTSSMEYKPMRALSEYIGEALRIREILKDTIYTGKFLDTLQVKVTGHDDVKFNTHLNPQNGERACVLVNFGDCAHEVTVNFDGKTDGSACLYEPYKEAKKMSIPATFTIPVKRFVVLKEC
ncbi:MAG: hypothetical protein FIA99_17220 [Ruminiclostridium sp.]|nr:hypothetical protein [Ruminiclostridium sp.]